MATPTPRAAGDPRATPEPSDDALLAGLRRGDEQAFVTLVRRYGPLMQRVAQRYVANAAAAEDVCQETWLGVLKGLDGFEGRAALKTWLFTILLNRARTRGARDGRVVPFSALAGADDSDEPAVAAERFLGPTHQYAGHWSSFPRRWDELPEALLLSGETHAVARRAIEQLPPGQRDVITLRDIEGWSAAEVCNVLGLSETNQRVLLHRARSKVRRALEQHLEVEATRAG